MKQKRFLTMLLALVMVFALAMPVLANDATDPQNVGPPNNNGDRPSHGETTLRSNDGGETWTSSGDDTHQATGRAQVADQGMNDIFVWARIVDLDADDMIYCIDIEWGNMKFVYGSDAGAWDPDLLEYGASTGSGQWFPSYEGEDFLDGINNKVTVTNRSNDGVFARFGYAFDADFAGSAGGGASNNLFNKTVTTDDRVVGNFFTDAVTYTFDTTITTMPTAIPTPTLQGEAGALAAALLLDDADMGTATAYSGITSITGYLEQNADPGMLIPRADNNLGPMVESDPVGAPGVFDKPTNHPFSRDVFFAFSGIPDDDSTLIGAPFTKVGIITVTIVPQSAP